MVLSLSHGEVPSHPPSAFPSISQELTRKRKQKKWNSRHSKISNRQMPNGTTTAVHLSVSVSVCVTFVVLTDCGSYTRPISTNPGSIEAGEHELTRRTCFVARRLEVVTVAGLLWISWRVLNAAGFRVFSPVFFLRTHTACCKYEAALPHLPLY